MVESFGGNNMKIIKQMEQKKRWTKEEDEILVQAISARPQNLSKCFIAAAEQIGRTAKAAEFRWYKYVKFTFAGRKAMLTIGPKTAFSGKNELDNSKVRPIKVRQNSFWRRILTILRLIK